MILCYGQIYYYYQNNIGDAVSKILVNALYCQF